MKDAAELQAFLAGMSDEESEKFVADMAKGLREAIDRKEPWAICFALEGLRDMRMDPSLLNEPAAVLPFKAV